VARKDGIKRIKMRGKKNSLIGFYKTLTSVETLSNYDSNYLKVKEVCLDKRCHKYLKVLEDIEANFNKPDVDETKETELLIDYLNNILNLKEDLEEKIENNEARTRADFYEIKKLEKLNRKLGEYKELYDELKVLQKKDLFLKTIQLE
jgi:DNA repair ATPase RecN